MQIISHRGYWISKAEMNTPAAFTRAFENGFGVETDLRDYCGGLVISHDIAAASALPLTDFFQLYRESGAGLPLALNIKADGLQLPLRDVLGKYRVDCYFVFDMSLPDMLGYRDAGFTFYTRQSEYETRPVLYREAAGVWLDCFDRDWISEELLAEHLQRQKPVCLVSPELHCREHLSFWDSLRKMQSLINDDRLMLCTDYPEKARLFFHE